MFNATDQRLPPMRPALLAGPLVVLALSRLAFPRSLPIFSDEAIYLFWGQRASSLELAWISHTDGKPPLHTWLLSLWLRLFADPLVAGRALSAIAGVLSLLAIACAARGLFTSDRAAVLAAWLYVLAPGALFYDRLATPDALLSALGATTLWLSVRLARERTFSVALATGAVLGLALLTKHSASLFMVLVPVAGLVAGGPRLRPDVARFLLLAVLGALIARAVASVQELSPLVEMLDRKLLAFAAQPSELLSDPLRFFSANLPVVADTFFFGATPAVLLLAVVGLLDRERRRVIFLAIWALLPPLMMALITRTTLPREAWLHSPQGSDVLLPRHLMPALPAMLLLASGALTRLLERARTRSATVLLVLSVATAAAWDAVLITSPENAPLAPEERAQHLEGWPAGQGIDEAVAIIRARAQDHRVDVIGVGVFGLIPMALQVHLSGEPNVIVYGHSPDAPLPATARERTMTAEVLVVRDAPWKWADESLELVARIARPAGRPPIEIHRLKP